MSVDYAKLEAKMFRFIELSDELSKKKFEKQALKNDIAKMIKEAGGFEHVAKMDENFQIVATVKDTHKNVFQGEQMARDLKVDKSATVRKDFLINMTQQGRLTLDKYKTYIHREPDESINIRRTKIKKRKKKK
ncbi:hypothetical protein AAXE64_27695 [Priestia megaterium]|uniref:hypothetical protein n=1 Tax=Priestia megaterium TaxID=1404 RepID=UPI003D057DF3